MSGSLIFIGPLGPSAGSGGGDGVGIYANFAALPGTATTGDMAITTNDGYLYWWNGSAWVIPNAEVVTVGVDNTNSVNLAVIADKVNATLNLSSAAATAGYFKATSSIVASGLHVEIQESSGSQTGVLTSANWTTFNNKEPAVTATTAADYYRGDKSFQALNVAALTAIVSGAAAATGKIGEILTGTQAADTSTGVGATGAWGSVTSVALTAGSWEITGAVGFKENGATLTDFIACGISDSATGVGINEFDTNMAPNLFTGSDTILRLSGIYVDIAAPATYYLNSKFNYSLGGPQHRGRIKARRLR